MIKEMQKLFFTLFLIICFVNISISQTKTPYEKKKEEVTLRYFKKMGVSMSEVERAKKADPSGMLVLLLVYQKLEEYAILHPAEALILITEFNKEIKAAEKLKGEADFAKERAKKEQEQQKTQQEKAKRERENIISDAKSDLWSGNYENALTKLEKANSIESTEETNQLIYETKIKHFISFFKSKSKNKIADLFNYPYDMGLLPAIKNKQEMIERFNEVFDNEIINKIANSSVSDWEEVGWRGIMLNNGDIWIDEFDERIKIREMNFSTSTYLEKKKEILEREKNSLHTSINNIEYPIIVGKTNTQRFRIDRLNENLRLTIWYSKTTPWNEKPDAVSENGIWQYDGGSEMIGAYIFKIEKFIYIIPDFEEKIITKDFEKITNVNWEKLMNGNTVDEENYMNLVDNDNTTIKIDSYKTLSRGEVIAEITKVEQRKKQQEYAQTALEKYNNGELNQAKLWYGNALTIKYDSEIAKKLKEVEEEIQRVSALKKQLEETYTDVSNHYLLTYSPQIISQLPTIKKGYDLKYNVCIEHINQLLQDEWASISNTYNENLPSFQKREIWIDEDQKMLNNLTVFSQKANSYKKFNDTIVKLIESNDKKSFKIFKEKDPAVIVTYILGL